MEYEVKQESLEFLADMPYTYEEVLDDRAHKSCNIDKVKLNGGINMVIASFKSFNGEKYGLFALKSTKAQADTMKRTLKKMGHKSRTVKVLGGYAVYNRRLLCTIEGY